MQIILNINENTACLICKRQFSGMRQLSNHIREHRLSTREYYDNYLKKPDEGKCKVCGNPTKYRTMGDGYADTCSPKCRAKYTFSDPEWVAARREKTVATNIEKYGVGNVFQNEAIKEKIRQTNIDNLGVAYPMQSKDVQEKAKDTYVERYGSLSYLTSEEGKAAVAATNMKKFGHVNFFGSEQGKQVVRERVKEKYGAEHIMQTEFGKARIKESSFKKYGMWYVQTSEFKDKSRDTQFAKYGNFYSASEVGRARYQEIMRDRFGTDELFTSDYFLAKASATLLAKYGVDNYAKTAEYKAKVSATNLARYGTEAYINSADFKAKSECTNLMLYGAVNYMHSDAYRKSMLERYGKFLTDAGCEIIGMDGHNAVTYRCTECGGECTEQWQFVQMRVSASLSPCSHCCPKNYPVSVEESELDEYVRSLGVETEHYDHNFIGSYGADIVIPDAGIIIEYDGIYWHSELFKESTYHLEKKFCAEEMGYRVIHVFSDEWRYKREIVKDRIAAILHAGNRRRIYARKCECKLIDHSVAAEFIDANHIQGSVGCNAAYGLYYGDELVSVMTFGKNRFGKSAEMELLRFCSASGTDVVGGAGKLFKRYVDDHPMVDSILSYADARWSDFGAVYGKLGFEFTGMSEPNYYYVVGDRRESRMKYQKAKLVAEGADAGKTEHEIMMSRGIYRIYDCGNYRYVWSRTGSV